jgi:hypothetical protein
MIESLLEAIDRILSQGKFSWGAIITALLFFNKIQRNKEFRLRDQRVERNQRRIMDHLGVEGEWPIPQRTLPQMVQQSLRKLYSSSRKETQQGNRRRKKKMKSKLLSRKLWMAIFGALLPIINQEFNLGLNTDTIIASAGAIVAYIIGQAHVDAKVAQNANTPVKSDPNTFIQG